MTTQTYLHTPHDIMKVPADHARRKVAELADRALDEWVARAEGQRVETFKSEGGGDVLATFVSGRGWMVISGGTTMEWLRAGVYRPSEDPAWGQPIMERARIAVEPGGDGWQALAGELFSTPHAQRRSATFNGPTMLIAGMRARVAQVYGDEVLA